MFLSCRFLHFAIAVFGLPITSLGFCGSRRSTQRWDARIITLCCGSVLPNYSITLAVPLHCLALIHSVVEFHFSECLLTLAITVLSRLRLEECYLGLQMETLTLKSK